MAPGTAAQLYQVTLIKGALATTAIEGNTLTLAEAEGIANGTFSAPPSRQYQEQELRNVLHALFELGERVLAENDGSSPQLTPDLFGR